MIEKQATPKPYYVPGSGTGTFDEIQKRLVDAGRTGKIKYTGDPPPRTKSTEHAAVPAAKNKPPKPYYVPGSGSSTFDEIQNRLTEAGQTGKIKYTGGPPPQSKNAAMAAAFIADLCNRR